MWQFATARISPTDTPASRSTSSSGRRTGLYIVSTSGKPTPMPVSSSTGPLGCRTRNASTTTAAPANGRCSGAVK
jgi:hypothetical protein